MKVMVSGLFVFLSVILGVGAASVGASDLETSEELEKQIKLLQHQIRDLRKKQDSLLRVPGPENLNEEQARKYREMIDKTEHYAKIEIRGRLRQQMVRKERGDFFPTDQWVIAIKEQTWALNFGSNKDLHALAFKHADKMVVITGSVAVEEKRALRPLQANPEITLPVLPSLPPPVHFYETPITVNVALLTKASD